MLAPWSAFTSRVVPTPNGRGVVQRTSCRIRHQCRASSAHSSAHTSAAGLAISKPPTRRIGALSRKLSSTGLHLNQGTVWRAYPGRCIRGGRSREEGSVLVVVLIALLIALPGGSAHQRQEFKVPYG